MNGFNFSQNFVYNLSRKWYKERKTVLSICAKITNSLPSKESIAIFRMNKKIIQLCSKFIELIMRKYLLMGTKHDRVRIYEEPVDIGKLHRLTLVAIRQIGSEPLLTELIWYVGFLSENHSYEELWGVRAEKIHANCIVYWVRQMNAAESNWRSIVAVNPIFFLYWIIFWNMYRRDHDFFTWCF